MHKHRQQWTPRDDEQLKELWGTRAAAKVAAKLGRTVVACKSRAEMMGIPQRGAQGKETINALAEMLGVDRCVLHLWIKRYNLKASRGPLSGRGIECYMVAPEDLEAFFLARPECFPWDTLRPRKLRALGVDLDALDAKVRRSPFKRVECHRGSEHAHMRPISWWTPIEDDAPQCPACGGQVSRYAAGEKGGRYKLRAPTVPVDDRLVPRHAVLLRHIASGAWTCQRAAAELVGVAKATIGKDLARMAHHGLVRRVGVQAFATPEALALLGRLP